MQNKTIVVTGANGYIGRVVVNKLINSLQDVKLALIDEAFTADRCVEYPRNVQVMEMAENISDVKGLEADCLIHLAAYTSVPESEINPDKYYINNCSFYNTFASHNKFDHIIYASSHAIYDDEGQINPLMVYGDTKYVGEFITKRHSRIHTIFRFANPVGVMEYHDDIIDNIISGYSNVFWTLAKCKVNNTKFEIHNIVGMVRDFYPVTWIGDAILETLRKTIVGTYSLGSEYPADVITTLKAICHNHDIAYKIVEPPAGVTKGRVIQDTILRELNIRPPNYNPYVYCENEFTKYVDAVRIHLGK